MNAVPAAALPATEKLSTNAAFFLLASITVTILAGSSAPTPLYPLYQAEWGFSALSITVIFGVYAIAVLAALLLFGRLSDHVGRRPVLLVAIVVQVLAMGVFMGAEGLGALLTARVIQGLSAGAAIAAVGAGLLDLDKRRGAVANAVSPPMGTALGGIMAGLTVSLLPAPAVLVYLLFGAIFFAQGVAVLRMKETFRPRAGALASLRPQFSFSRGTRAPLLRAAPAIIASWTVVGFFASLGPALLKSVLGTNSALLSGLVLFVMAGSGGAAVLLLQHQAPRAAMRTGAAGLAIGLLLVAVALSLQWPLLFFAGLIATGAGFGSGFQGAVRSVMAEAHADERAGVLSVIFVIAYLAMGLPVMGAGYLLVHGNSLISVAHEFGVGIVLLAMLPLALRSRG